MTISALPTAPSRDMTPSNFIVAADAFVAALPTFVTEANALQLDVNGKQIAASNAATAAGVSATLASNAADAAAAYSNFLGEWDNLTGAATVPTTVYHNGEFWTLINNLADVTASEPSVSADWVKSSSIVYLPYADRNNIRSSEASGITLIEGLGVFTYESGSTASDNDSTIFETTNGAWLLRASLGGGVGSTTANGSITLTKNSLNIQTITPTKFGQSITLPDATTMLPNSDVFTLQNRSGFPVAIKDSTGIIRGFISPYKTVRVGLADKTTAAGVWVLPDAEWFAITSSFNINAVMVNPMLVELDQDRIFVSWHVASGYLYGVVLNITTQVQGSVTAIRTNTTATYGYPVKSGTDQVLIVSCSATTTALEAVVLSISGVSITVNTPATATLAGAWTVVTNNSPEFLAVGSSYILSYGRTTSTSAIRAMTISGTTVTIGAEATLSPANTTSGRLFAVDASTLIATCSSSALLYVKPFSVSGSTLTAGTEVSIGNNSTTNYSFGQFGNYWLATSYGAPSNTMNVSIITLTGIVATISTVALGSTSVQTEYDLFFPSSASVCVLYRSGNTAKLACITNTAGTAALGSSVNLGVYTTTPNTTVIISDDANVVSCFMRTTASRDVVSVDVSNPSSLSVIESVPVAKSPANYAPAYPAYKKTLLNYGNYYTPSTSSDLDVEVWLSRYGVTTSTNTLEVGSKLYAKEEDGYVYYTQSTGAVSNIQKVMVAQP